MIEHLACEKDVVWCIDSYFNREPTHLMMDAVENSVLWEIPRDIMEELSDANGDIAYLYRSFFENSLMFSQLKADILRFESAMIYNTPPWQAYRDDACPLGVSI